MCTRLTIATYPCNFGQSVVTSHNKPITNVLFRLHFSVITFLRKEKKTITQKNSRKLETHRAIEPKAKIQYPSAINSWTHLSMGFLVAWVMAEALIFLVFRHLIVLVFRLQDYMFYLFLFMIFRFVGLKFTVLRFWICGIRIYRSWVFSFGIYESSM